MSPEEDETMTLPAVTTATPPSLPRLHLPPDMPPLDLAPLDEWAPEPHPQHRPSGPVRGRRSESDRRVQRVGDICFGVAFVVAGVLALLAQFGLESPWMLLAVAKLSVAVFGAGFGALLAWTGLRS